MRKKTKEEKNTTLDLLYRSEEERVFYVKVAVRRVFEASAVQIVQARWEPVRTPVFTWRFAIAYR